MKTIIKISWFDKITEHLVSSEDITYLFSELELKLLVGEKIELCDSYPLSKKQFDFIAKRSLTAFSDKYDYFLDISGDWTLDLRDAVWVPAPASEFTDKAPINRLAAEQAFLSQDKEKILDALVRVTFFDPDPYYIQETCLTCLKQSDSELQKQAIACIGHLARMHGKVDTKKVLPLLRAKATVVALKEVVEEALDDIECYLNVKRQED